VGCRDERIEEGFNVVEAVELGRVLEVRAVRVLVAVTELHECLVGPRIFEQDGHVDDAGFPLVVLDVGRRFDLFELCDHLVRMDDAGIDAKHVGRRWPGSSQ